MCDHCMVWWARSNRWALSQDWLLPPAAKAAAALARSLLTLIVNAKCTTHSNCSHLSCLCSPSSKTGSSPLKGCEESLTAGLVESNGSLSPGLWLTSPVGWLPRTGISSGTLRSIIEYRLLLPVTYFPARTQAPPNHVAVIDVEFESQSWNADVC